MRPIAALYVDALSGPYPRLDGVECWSGVPSQLSLMAGESERDAMAYAGPDPVVAHPPCGHWGRWRRRCKQPRSWAIAGLVAFWQVRNFGGVLEHPAYSTLWDVVSAARPGEVDEFGGWTLQVNQTRWGHPCKKPTWLYVVGVSPEEMPALPEEQAATHCMVRLLRNSNELPELPKRKRHLTPFPFAEWLVDVARRSGRPLPSIEALSPAEIYAKTDAVLASHTEKR